MSMRINADQTDIGVSLAAGGLYCLSPGYTVWVGLNTGGQTKRATAIALQVVAAQCGGLVGSNIYLTSEKRESTVHLSTHNHLLCYFGRWQSQSQSETGSGPPLISSRLPYRLRRLLSSPRSRIDRHAHDLLVAHRSREPQARSNDGRRDPRQVFGGAARFDG